uniref:Uncharacterized protein n=1 Tax=Glossina austeni TaxID=7395 RepID=A0A1A9VFZ8_GLOAU
MYLKNAGDDDNVDDCVCICVEDDDEVGVKQLPFNKDFLRKCFVNIVLNVMEAGNDKNRCVCRNHMFLGNSFISSRQKTDDNDNKNNNNTLTVHKCKLTKVYIRQA